MKTEIPKPDPKSKCCLSCHYEGRGRYPGSLWLYIPLYLFGFIPGLVYWLFRTSAGQCVCFNCGKATIVPASSPVGVEIHNDNVEREEVRKFWAEAKATRAAGVSSCPAYFPGAKT